MTENYFSIERGGECIDHVHIKNEDGNLIFEDVMNMSYENLKEYEDIDVFITYVMDVTNDYFNGKDEQTIITLVGNDDVFIWSIIIGPGENNDELKYCFLDWKKDGNFYRYEKSESFS